MNRKIIKRFICWIDDTNQEGLRSTEPPIIIKKETLHEAMYEFHKKRGIDLESFEDFKKEDCTGWGIWCEELK
jgi:hypothetical protein